MIRKRIRILHLEDNPNDASLIQAILESDGIEAESVLVDKADTFIAELDKGEIDLILSDYTLPTFDGLTALKIAQTMRPEIPFIFVSGTIGEERAIEAVRRGATDYVVKERLMHLTSVVRRVMREKEERHKRIEAEKSLRESEERFRALVENSTDGIALVSAEGNILYAGPSTVRIIGYTSEEFEGRNAFEFIHPNDRHRTMTLLGDLVSKPGTTLTTVYRIKHKNGRWRWMEATGNNLLKDPVVRAIVVNYRDITDRKESEDRLTMSEASLAAAQRIAHLGSWELELVNLDDVNRNPLRWSDEVYRIFGYEPGAFEPSNERFFDAVHPGDREKIRRAVTQAINEGKHYLVEHRIMLPDGSEKIVREQSEIIYSGGKPLKMLGTVLDITEQRRASETLRQSEENYRSLFESARDAIFTIATNGRITALNTAFESITGWSREEWLGKTFSDILHPEERQLALELFARVLQGEVPPVQEYRIRKKSNEYLVGEFTTTPQILDGKLVGLLGVTRDITERKKLEAEVRHAQRMESIGTLAGGISHDFNNILGILLGFISILRGGKLNPSQTAEILGSMETAVQRGAQLVKQILTFARKSDLLMQPTSVNSVIEELSKMLKETFPRSINLILKLEKQLPAVEADAGQIHQALLNLCVNARDAMPKGGDLSISTSKVRGMKLKNRFIDAIHEEYIQVDITDSGTGIDESTKSRIFEPFFTTKEPGKGTGLGLAVVFGVAKSHRGFVDVQSAVGRGTTFSLFFPVATKTTAKPAGLVSDLESVVGGTETILVVEDELALQELLKAFLEEKGYTVLTASNGLEAVEVFTKNKEKISLLFSDIGLPKMSGMDAFQKIKEVKPGIKTIFASGFIEPFERSEIARMGVQEFLQKPYDPVKILLKIREVLDNK